MMDRLREGVMNKERGKNYPWVDYPVIRIRRCRQLHHRWR